MMTYAKQIAIVMLGLRCVSNHMNNETLMTCGNGAAIKTLLYLPEQVKGHVKSQLQQLYASYFQCTCTNYCVTQHML